MAESPDRESRTEDASEKKIRDAIDKGNVPFSREAATFGSLIGILAVGVFLAPAAAEMRAILQRFIDDPAGWRLENGADAVRLLALIGIDLGWLVAPAIAVLAVFGTAASMLQNPPRLVLERIRPQASRVSLSRGWARLFGVQGLVEFLKGALKFAIVSLVACLLIGAVRNDVLNAMFMEPGALPRLIGEITVRLLAGVAVATLALVVLDLVWSRLFWRRELRMTRQEVKDEAKQMDGDPIVRARLRSLARDRSRRRMMAAVPRASFVVANPTHYAVALRYVREEDSAPRVLAKGRDLVALRIRAVAEESGVPVIEDKLLARSLHDKVEVDRTIPPEFYKAVAEIVLHLMSRAAAQRKSRQRMPQGG